MTLGNDQPPLTRRQARELARGQEPEPTIEERKHSSTTEERKAPQPRRPGTPETTQGGKAPQITVTPNQTPHVSTRPESTQKTDVTDVAPAVSAFARRATDADLTSASMTTNERPMPERTLTRRELRAKKSAEAAQAEAPGAAGTGSVEVEAEVVIGTAMADENAGLEPLHPPVGHWSVDRDDGGHTQTIGQSQPFDQLISRGISAGGSPTTTSALILPSIPRQGTASGPLNSTGEILITGSIDLPRSLGATGQHPNHFDSSDLDNMLDQLDEPGPTAGVAPVSASSAVSTHTSTRKVMTPPKKRAISVPTVLAVTAAVLAIGVLALFVGGYLFGVF